MLPGPAVPGSCLVSFHFLWAILCPQTVRLLDDDFLVYLQMRTNMIGYYFEIEIRSLLRDATICTSAFISDAVFELYLKYC